MVVNTTPIGTVPAGSQLIAIGNFITSMSPSLLLRSPSGSYFLWTQLGSSAHQEIPVTLPSGYDVVDAGIYNAATPGVSQLLLQDGSGDLAYGAYASNIASFAATMIGNPGSGWSVEGSADYNTWYNGNEQVLLQTIQSGIGTLQAYQSNLPPFTIPAGFAVVPDATGNFFGTDLPETLLCNASGTVEAIMNGGMVTTAGVTSAVVQESVLGILQAGQTIDAVGGLNSNGSTDILLQNAGTLSEWVVQNGVIKQTVVLGTLPQGSGVLGLADLNGDGITDVLLMTNAGSIETIAGSIAASSSNTLVSQVTSATLAIGNSSTTTSAEVNDIVSTAPGRLFGTQEAAVIVDPNYSAVTNAGVDSTLSDYLAQLTSGALAATGATILTMQQGALSNCSYEQVAAGNITLAAWQQNVAILNAIALYCRNNGIEVQIETQLGGLSDFGPPQTEQWVAPAVAAGLPVAYVEDNQECPNWQDLNVNTMATQELANIAIIHNAFPNAKFGEWDVAGDIENSGTISAYHAFLENWWATLNGSAEALGLPGISYVIADQYYSPELVAGTGTVGAAGQDPGQDIMYNEFADFASDAGADGISVEIQAAASDVDLNPLQILGRESLEVSQESTLGISAIQLSAGFNAQPVSAAVNAPGSTYNCAAEIAAVEPLYQLGLVTTAGSISLTLPSQLVLLQGVTIALSGVSVNGSPADQGNRLAVVLIDQTGTLSATQEGEATITSDGPNILILNGTPADVSAELATLTLDEAVGGPDSVAVEVFGNTGLVTEGTISVLATNPNGSATYTPNGDSATPQLWDQATAQVNNGVVVQETMTWNATDGLSSAALIGGAIIMPIVQVAVDQPLLEEGLTAPGAVASLPSIILDWHTVWQVYDPLDPESETTAETVPVTETASTLMFSASTGNLEEEVDTLAAVPSSAYTNLFPFLSTNEPFYFADGGLAITLYDLANNPYWTTTLYDNGAGGISEISSGSTMVIADGSTTSMAVGSVDTIYGIVNGADKVIEVRYLGAASDPYDEVDQIFNPYSATPQLWQQVETVGIPTPMTGGSLLTVPSATTVIEFNTGNNPNWSNTIWTDVGGDLETVSVAGDLEVATTFEAGNWDAQAEISASSVATVQRGVTWIGEGEILSAYNLPSPAITAWTSTDSISGTGIAGDWIVVTGSDGQTLGGAEVGGSGTWIVAPSAAFTPSGNYAVTAQQFDLAGDSSSASASFSINSGIVLSNETIIGSPGTVVSVAGQNITVIGSGLSISATGLLTSVAISGTGNTVSAVAGTFINDIGTTTTLNLVASGATLAASTGDMINQQGTNDTLSFANGGTLGLGGTTSAIVSGNSVVAWMNMSGDALSVAGPNNIITGGANETVTIDGNYNTASISDGGTVNVNGQNSGIIGSGLSIAATGSLTSFWVSGTNDTVSLTSGGSLVNVFGLATIGFISGSNSLTVATNSFTSQTVSGFSVAGHDQIDLSNYLRGLPTNSADLSRYIGVTDVGSSTVLAITGPAGTDTVTLSGAGALSLQQLINGNTFIYPSG